MRIEMGYPDRAAEVAILETQSSHLSVEELSPVASAAQITAMVESVALVHVADTLRSYIVDVADATRHHHDLALGASPRGALALQGAARALAATLGRDFVLPDDVKRVAAVVLEHRLLLTPDAELRGRTPGDVLADVLASVAVPGATGLA
jgi:MoxR-like ATPase